MCLSVQQEIVDETDIYEDVNTGLRRGGPRVDVANFLAMFEHKLNHFQVWISSSSHAQHCPTPKQSQSQLLLRCMSQNLGSCS